MIKPFGTFTIDDFSPMTEWPPMFDGNVDEGQRYWLTQADVLAPEIRVAPDMSVLVGQYTPGRSGP